MYTHIDGIYRNIPKRLLAEQGPRVERVGEAKKKETKFPNLSAAHFYRMRNISTEKKTLTCLNWAS